MGKKIDYSKVRARFDDVLYRQSGYTIQRDNYFYNRKKLNSQQVKSYQKWLEKHPNAGQASRYKAKPVPKKISSYFSKGTVFRDQQGHYQSWIKSATLKGGKGVTNSWGRAKYVGPRGIGRVGSNQKWLIDINRGKRGSGGGELTPMQWVRHLQIALYQVNIQAENFRIMVGKRALKVFQDSFREQKFYSNKGRKWPSLSSYTLQKRAKRGTGSRILREYGDLLNSIKVEDNAGVMTTRVYTDIVPANASHHKKHSICYAGYHNEGKGRYGAARNGHTPKPYVKRKFMGHSSHLNPLTDAWLRKMMKQYLFDSVFQVKK